MLISFSFLNKITLYTVLFTLSLFVESYGIGLISPDESLINQNTFKVKNIVCYCMFMTFLFNVGRITAIVPELIIRYRANQKSFLSNKSNNGLEQVNYKNSKFRKKLGFLLGVLLVI